MNLFSRLADRERVVFGERGEVGNLQWAHGSCVVRGCRLYPLILPKKTKNRFYPIFFKRLIHPELFLRAAPRFPCQKRIFNSSAASSFPTFFFSGFFFSRVDIWAKIPINIRVCRVLRRFPGEIWEDFPRGKSVKEKIVLMQEIELFPSNFMAE